MATSTDKKVDIPDDIKAMDFEEALGALEEIVRNLESGQVSLEKSIDIYTRGTQLRAHCDEKLKDATARIEKITKSGNGALNTSPLDGEN
ncbi:exodeoxyribonuclease VII small subunit [Emcibacteraceae bacterium]|uniref:exodeoxyribonuclease VII small subunit n=1 Tax=Pseudemcibacter sp. TaxID=2943293 RepID=UPI00231F4761|nr:exodeoxyribonuclease VII small subunit [Emcibacteraceae bacterium]MDA9180312.1 exodeoxyribonuclease VII small subunit [Emcibacteraceae bacterium]MDA9771377.1 exodeoxyribonuclease VII small subunit [Emcibacteraceae bacterium]MDC1090239.1 exodeoxyribonuclease VII small subunit [Emcibacteraceae bacterium]MDG1020705.1 exodeoxyribonuclease VII small subunit [Emcibacteraceae bacterium]